MNTASLEKQNYGWLDQLDGRTGIAQAMRERFLQFTDDLGGLQHLSYSQRSLVERALWLEKWLASQEQKLATGEGFNIAQWIQGTNSLLGIFNKLGYKKTPKYLREIDDILSR
jgi:hypothetical protein